MPDAITGGILGLGLGMINDSRQVRQQERLSNLQEKYNFRMMAQQQKNQLEMWEKTNYAAQKEQMKKAGLNPALLYGMSGGGGVTTGTGGTPAGPGGQATGQSGEIMGLLQMRTQEAQIKLMEAEAKKASTEADKLAGVDTDKGRQDIDESKSRTAINQVHKDILEVENMIKQQTAQESINSIQIAMQKASQEYDRLVRENSIGEATYETQIKQAQEDLVQTGLQNALLKSTKKLTDRQTWKITEEIAQGWAQLSINEQQLAINNVQLWVNQQNADTSQKTGIDSSNMQRFERSLKTLADHEKETLEIVKGILQAVMVKRALSGPARQPIGFKPN